MTVNLPFSTLALVAGDPIFVAADADDNVVEQARRQVENSLNSVTARAYELARADIPKVSPSESSGTPSRYL